MNGTIEKSSRLERPSGRFVLRIDPDLHASLRHAADKAGTSLNELCSRKLALPGTPLPDGILEAVRKASDLLGDDVLGAVAFGSWARDDMVEESDIDLLVVVAASLKIERSLYRRWDESPLTWNGHRIEPHFVHLPAKGERISGLWAEVALDGIVLFDSDHSVSRRMAEIRSRVASGELIRRWRGGHPYWVEVA